jgi:hypothetical protein
MIADYEVTLASDDDISGILAFWNHCAFWRTDKLPPLSGIARTDNVSSLRAHRKMGMRKLGPFVSDGVAFIALTYAD